MLGRWLLLLLVTGTHATNILTFNLWTPVLGGGANATQRLELFLQETAPYDVLCLQEIFNLHLFSLSLVGHAKWLEGKLRHYGFTHTIGPSGVDKMFTMEDDGLLIASRYPLTNTTRLLFKRSRIVDTWTRKGVIMTHVDAPTPFYLLNTHLQAYESLTDKRTRFEQIMEMNTLITNEAVNGELVVVCGDLNVDAGTQEYDLIMKYLKAKDTAVNLLTYPSIQPTTRLDYILLLRSGRGASFGCAQSPRLCAQHHGITYNGCSDHWPLHLQLP